MKIHDGETSCHGALTYLIVCDTLRVQTDRSLLIPASHFLTGSGPLVRQRAAAVKAR